MQSAIAWLTVATHFLLLDSAALLFLPTQHLPSKILPIINNVLVTSKVFNHPSALDSLQAQENTSTLYLKSSTYLDPFVINATLDDKSTYTHVADAIDFHSYPLFSL